VRGIPGRWFTGKVRGRLIEEGWGATMGFPALVLDPTGPEVEVQVLEFSDCPSTGNGSTSSKARATSASPYWS
jgi:hypothetical protein